MLQQTTVAAVIPYFTRFKTKWPTVVHMANAPVEDILEAWAGLGYYARARNLHKCAIKIARENDGRFPDTETELLQLPGIGPYTAAAIASIAFGRHATVVDGNVERVMARHYAINVPLPDAKADLKQLAKNLTPMVRCGDYAQAIMDLGATVCTPKSPKCVMCPWQSTCAARTLADPSIFPKKRPKTPKPTRRGYALWLETSDGKVTLERRPPSGLLGGMLGFPGTEWSESKYWPSPPGGDLLDGMVTHTFTHFNLELRVVKSDTQQMGGAVAEHYPIASLHDCGLPTIMRKIAEHVISSKEQAHPATVFSK